MSTKMAVHYSSASADWHTPAAIIERAVRTMGAIDLDQCSNDGPPVVPAFRYYRLADDGLARAWDGRIYMNPPYGRDIGRWIEKLCLDYEGEYVTEAVALLPARTDTAWFRRLRYYTHCFLWGRLKFSGHTAGAPFPSVVVYLGPHVPAFAAAFSDIGDIYQTVTTRGKEER